MLKFILFFLVFIITSVIGYCPLPAKQRNFVRVKSVSAFDDESVEIDPDDDIGIQSDTFKSGFVSILGNPNVGKSTLMNSLLGEKLSIVSPKPQTTRHRILGVYTQPNFQLVFSDTPGMMEPAYMLQEAMMDTVRGAVGDADVIVLVTDVYGEPLVDARVIQKLSVTQRPVVIAINKMDLIEGLVFNYTESPAASDTTRSPASSSTRLFRRRRLTASSPAQQAVPSAEGPTPEPSEGEESEGDDSQRDSEEVKLERRLHSFPELRDIWARRLPRARVIPVCAKNGTGVDAVLQELLAHVPYGPKYFPSDVLTNRDERFFTAEIIREAIFGLYKDEVPYSCEVLIDTFQDKSPSLSVIECSIVVNRDSQRLIMIGKGGLKLKALGTAAREKLEEFLDRKVYLSMKVKVDPDWRMNKDSLIKYGYIEDNFS